MYPVKGACVVLHGRRTGNIWVCLLNHASSLGATLTRQDCLVFHSSNVLILCVIHVAIRTARIPSDLNALQREISRL